MLELRAIFRGRVQAVGFRITAQKLAQESQINGFVRNLSDGTVELVAQGSKRKLSLILEKLSELFHLTGVDHHFAVPSRFYEGFSILS